MKREQVEVGPHNDHREAAERCVLDLIKNIKSKKSAAKSLNTEDRRACVEHLTTEGLSVNLIANPAFGGKLRCKVVKRSRLSVDHLPGGHVGFLAQRCLDARRRCWQVTHAL